MSKHSIHIFCALLLAIECPLFAAGQKTDFVDWWEGSSLYQIYPRSFQDSNGDGIGDLNGITSRLAYLKEIGITATWLSPIFESPMADFGYDISNFTRIDPIFGTLDDFDALIAKAKEIGVKILLDFVPNHSSDEHVWFQKSIKREDGFDDFYVWHDGSVNSETGDRQPPSNWVSIFGGPMWTWNEERQQYYMHQFLAKQPDLNFHNAKVHEHMLAVLEYWLDRGVDGFRIDAVPHIYEVRNADGTYPNEPVIEGATDPNSYSYHNHIYTKDIPETATLMYEWRQFLKDYQKKNGGDSRILLAESYSPVDFLSNLFSNGTHDGTQIPMNFQLMDITQDSTAQDVEKLVDNWMSVMWTKHKTANWVVGNHDGPRVANRVGPSRVDQINIIVSALPGASVTYYGDEIGMTNVKTECTPSSCDSRDPERTPMQWSSASNAGFTTNENPWLPVAPDYKRCNVERQRGIARSSLQIYKAMHKLKTTSAFKAFKKPEGFVYGAINENVFQIVRSNGVSEEYRILVNLGSHIEVLEGLTDKTMEYIILTSYSPHKLGDTVDLKGRLMLMPHEAIVLQWRV